jgi:hypothetical protein
MIPLHYAAAQGADSFVAVLLRDRASDGKEHELRLVQQQMCATDKDGCLPLHAVLYASAHRFKRQRVIKSSALISRSPRKQPDASTDRRGLAPQTLVQQSQAHGLPLLSSLDKTLTMLARAAMCVRSKHHIGQLQMRRGLISTPSPSSFLWHTPDKWGATPAQLDDMTRGEWWDALSRGDCRRVAWLLEFRDYDCTKTLPFLERSPLHEACQGGSHLG